MCTKLMDIAAYTFQYSDLQIWIFLQVEHRVNFNIFYLDLRMPISLSVRNDYIGSSALVSFCGKIFMIVKIIQQFKIYY